MSFAIGLLMLIAGAILACWIMKKTSPELLGFQIVYSVVIIVIWSIFALLY